MHGMGWNALVTERMKGRLMLQEIFSNMFAICCQAVAIGWESKALVFTDELCAFACVVEAFSKGRNHFEKPVRFSDKSIKQQEPTQRTRTS